MAEAPSTRPLAPTTAIAEAPTTHSVNVLLKDMETAFRDVKKFQTSKVKLPVKEIHLLTQLGKLRDAMWVTLKDPDRDHLVELFGGDCSRIARISAVLAEVKLSPMNAEDQRLQGCLKACQSVEQVLADLGSYETMTAAEEEARRKLLEGEKPEDRPPTASIKRAPSAAGVVEAKPASGVADSGDAPPVVVEVAPYWAEDGMKVIHNGRSGVIVGGASPGLFKIRWEDDAFDSDVAVWAGIEQAPPYWAAVGVKVSLPDDPDDSSRVGRRGIISSKDPWTITMYVLDTTTLETVPMPVVDWSGITEDVMDDADHGAAENPPDMAFTDEKPQVGVVVEDDWAELMGIEMCKLGCGRRVAPGKTRSGKTFDTCCRECAMGRGHTKTCGQTVDETKLGGGRCKMGCGRLANPGKDSMGIKRDTCCRGCSLGQDHDEKCGKDTPDERVYASLISKEHDSEHAFFATAKVKLGLVNFNQFMEQCRFMNRGQQTAEETLKSTRPLFGDDEKLFASFTRLLLARVEKIEASKASKKPSSGYSSAGAKKSPEAVALCFFSGCGKPTFNGRPGEYCSVEHRREDRRAKPTRFLPVEITGILLLEPAGPNEWTVTKAHFKAPPRDPGLAFRKSKEVDDKLGPGSFAPWGSTIRGHDEGGGWIRVE